MKYESKKCWAVDMEIISDDSNLCAAQIKYCVNELREAVKNHGGVKHDTDGHKFHNIWVWADEHSDLKAIMQIACVMCTEGCTVICDGGHEREDYLMNFDCRLQQIG